MSKNAYAKLETNRMNIKVSELVALAKIFHTDTMRSFPNFSKPKKQLNLKFLLFYRSFLFSPFFSSRFRHSIWVNFRLTFTTDCIPNPV